MTQEQKELLLKDICARLPYGVKLSCKWKTHAPNGTYGMITTMDSFVLDQVCNIEDTDVPFDEFKPYLFPLSSMTEEQSKELEEIDPEFYSLICENGDIYVSMDVRGYDWLNKNHLDYRGLIPMGLANDATGKNIY